MKSVWGLQRGLGMRMEEARGNFSVWFWENQRMAKVKDL